MSQEQLLYPGGFVEAQGDKPAYIMAGTGETVTYRELHERACRIAQLIRSRGIEPGEHVAWCMENHPWFLSLAWGALYAGVYFTAISSRLTAEEVAYIVNDCGAKLFVTTPYKAEIAAELMELTPGVQARFSLDSTLDGHESFEDAVNEQAAEELSEAIAGADMLYSSGTTGRPKGVKVPLAGVPVTQPEPLYMLVAGLFGANADTTYLSPAPLYHAAPLRFCMQVQRGGGTVIVMEQFDPVETLRLIEKYKVSFAQFVPTMFVRMLKLDPDQRSAYDVSSIQVAVHAAAPCPIAVKE
ncbi:MAG: AMP-binding protein, partial [Microthrixaceae bacterium]|nr:AMP-binding protein [Microthrixaceae bacterium]